MFTNHFRVWEVASEVLHELRIKVFGIPMIVYEKQSSEFRTKVSASVYHLNTGPVLRSWSCSEIRTIKSYVTDIQVSGIQG